MRTRHFAPTCFNSIFTSLLLELLLISMRSRYFAPIGLKSFLTSLLIELLLISMMTHYLASTCSSSLFTSLLLELSLISMRTHDWAPPWILVDFFGSGMNYWLAYRLLLLCQWNPHRNFNVNATVGGKSGINATAYGMEWIPRPTFGEIDTYLIILYNWCYFLVGWSLNRNHNNHNATYRQQRTLGTIRPILYSHVKLFSFSWLSFRFCFFFLLYFL